MKTTLTGNARHLLGNTLPLLPIPFLYILLFSLRVQVLGSTTHYSSLLVLFSYLLLLSISLDRHWRLQKQAHGEINENGSQADEEEEKEAWTIVWQEIIRACYTFEFACKFLWSKQGLKMYTGFAFRKFGLGEEFIEANKS